MEPEANGSCSFLLKVLLAAIALLCIHCGGGGGTSPDAGVPDGPICTPNHEWIIPNSTMQLAQNLVDPNFCKSGWTELKAELDKQNAGGLPPLQPEYVNPKNGQFASVRQFGEHLAASFGALGRAMPTTRFSLSWPCIMASPEIRTQFEEALAKALAAGYRVELTLSHRDSYPAALHKLPGGLDLPGGWAHPDAPQAFADYVEIVLDMIGSLLPDGSVIYLSSEPMADLFDGYLHKNGKYPPGGKNAGRSLATALINARDAFMAAGRRLREYGYVPAIAQNIRPLRAQEYTPEELFLDYLYNWWLLDALVLGCLNDDFDLEGTCERMEDPVVAHSDLTYYGTMQAKATLVEFGLPGGPTRPLLDRTINPEDFAPDPGWFSTALEWMQDRYRQRLDGGTLKIAVAEIGFSDTDLTQKILWLQDYLTVLNDLGIRSLGLHGMFRHAEFQSGEWNFHMVARCETSVPGGRCELTDWGQEVLDIIALDCTPALAP